MSTHEQDGASLAWAYRLMWIAIAGFVAAMFIVGCGRVDLHRSVDGMSKALRAGAVALEHADEVIGDATELQAARCAGEASERARAACMGMLNARHQRQIAELFVLLARLYDAAAKSLPKIEAILADLDRYLKAAKAAQ